MADHQNSTSQIIAQGFYQPVKRRRRGLVEPLGRFIQHKNMRIVQNCARQQHPLKLPTGKPTKLLFFNRFNARFRQGGPHGPVPTRTGRFKKRRTVIGNAVSICRVWGTYPIRKSARLVIVPLVGAIAPIMARSNVDLPDPLGPTIVTISDGSSASDTPNTARVAPWRTSIFLASISGILTIFLVPAGGANAPGFKNGAFNLEPSGGGRCLHRGPCFAFGDHATAVANHEGWIVIRTGVCASNKGI